MRACIHGSVHLWCGLCNLCVYMRVPACAYNMRKLHLVCVARPERACLRANRPQRETGRQTEAGRQSAY